jgi:acyl carrier protein
MDKKEIKKKILLIIKNYLEDNGIDAQDLNEKSNLMKDYELDSLDYLELFDNLEEKLDIQVSDNMKDYDALLSVEQLIQYVISNKTNV